MNFESEDKFTHYLYTQIVGTSGSNTIRNTVFNKIVDDFAHIEKKLSAETLFLTIQQNLENLLTVYRMIDNAFILYYDEKEFKGTLEALFKNGQMDMLNEVLLDSLSTMTGDDRSMFKKLVYDMYIETNSTFLTNVDAVFRKYFREQGLIEDLYTPNTDLYNISDSLKLLNFVFTRL